MDKIIIGIDPGVHTGFCSYNATRKRIELLKTFSFWEAIEWLNVYNHTMNRPSVIMEDPNGNRPVFSRGIDGRRSSKIAQNVGANKRDAILIAEYCERNNIPITGVTPTARSMTKMKAEAFKTLTGWGRQSSEHSRDAAMLVWGM